MQACRDHRARPLHPGGGLRTLACLAFVLGAGLAARECRAEPAPVLDGVYEVEGKGALGPYRGQLRFTPGSGGTEVTGEVRFDDGSVNRVSGRGTAVEGGGLRVDWPAARSGALDRIDLVGRAGATGAGAAAAGAAGGGARGRTYVDYRAEANGDKGTGRRVLDLLDGAAVVELGTETLRRRALRDLSGTLLRVARRELERLAYKPEDVSKSFHVLDYLNFGAGAGGRLLKPEELSPVHRAGSEAFRAAGRGDPVWAILNVSGGPRVSFGVPIPLSAGLTISTGFSAGSQLRYSVTAPFPKDRASGILDSAAEAFELPLSAARADELVPGEAYVLEGNSHVTLSESLGVGQGLGGIAGIVRVEASAGEHATVSLRGNFKFEVQRLDAAHVRLGVTNVRARQADAGVHVLVGAFVNRDLFPPAPDFLPGTLDVTIYKKLTRKLTNEVAGRIEDLLKVDFRIGGSILQERQFELVYVFDLREADARAAYENAVRGDLRGAQEIADVALAANGAPGAAADAARTGELPRGVVREKLRTLDLAQTSNYASLKLSLLRANASTTVTDLKELLATHDGVVLETRTARFERRGRDIFGNEGLAFLEKVDTHWSGGAGEPGSSMTLTYRSAETNTYTRRSEVNRVFRLVEHLLGDAAPRAEMDRIRANRPRRGFLRSAYGDSKIEWEVEFGEAGVRRALASPDADVWSAYAEVYRAAEEDRPRWGTPEGREAVERDRRWAEMGMRDRNEDPWLRRELEEMERAGRFVEGMRRIRDLRRAGRPEEEVNAELLSMARNERYELYGVGAIVRLAGAGGSVVRLRLQGKDLDFSAEGGELRGE
ncbi:MAG: hypothetical protein HYZ53_02155 [Planctomycetes bacterium]|nr:hypothetical protein [Planctomycetota bacterium]